MTLAFTDRAKEKVKSFIDAGQGKNPVLRIRISGRNLSGFSYQFFLEGEGDKRPDDQECEIGSFRVRTSGEHAKDLVGASVDWVEDASGSCFKVANPNPPMPHLKGTPAERIQQVIEAEINPSIAAHGGSAEVVDYKDGGNWNMGSKTSSRPVSRVLVVVARISSGLAGGGGAVGAWVGTGAAGAQADSRITHAARRLNHTKRDDRCIFNSMERCEVYICMHTIIPF